MLYVAAPASAASVSTWADLTREVGPACTNDSVVQLVADVRDGAGRTDLQTECDLTIDLNGHRLTTATVTIAAGTRLTVTDQGGGGVLDAKGADGTPTTATAPGTSGTPGLDTTEASLTLTGAASVTATGGVNTSGIGGRYDSGDVTVSGEASVDANGGEFAAGIGGGWTGDAGSVTVQGDAEVRAYAGEGGAGIGGGALGDGGSVAVRGTATVTASGDSGGAAIGGGKWNNGGSLVVGPGAEVITSGAWSGGESAVGVGAGGDRNGSITLAGTLRLQGPPLSLQGGADPALTVERSGLIAGPLDDPDGSESPHSRIDGPGTIANHGVIALGDVAAGVEITDHNFQVLFHRGAGADTTQVYGGRFRGSFREIPLADVGYQQWHTAPEGAGAALTLDTELSDHAAVAGGAQVVDVYAAEIGTTTVLDEVPGNLAPGEATPLMATVAAAGPGGGTPTGEVTFAYAPSAVESSHVVLGEVNVDGTGIARLPSAAFEAGTYEVTATFESPDTGFAASTATQTLAVGPVETESGRSPGVGPEDEVRNVATGGPRGVSPVEAEPSPAPDPGQPADPSAPESTQPAASSPTASDPGPSPTRYGHSLVTLAAVLTASPVAPTVAVAVAAGFLLLVAIPLELLYGTLRQNYERLVFVPAFLRRGWTAWRAREFHPVWRWAGVGAMFATGAMIAALAEPGVGSIATATRLFSALVLSLGLMNLAAVLLGRVTAARLALPNVVRLMPGFLVIAGVGVLASRLLGLHPGILFGLLAMTVVTTQMNRAQAGAVALVVNGGFLALGVLAWLLYGFLDPILVGGSSSSLWSELVREMLTAIAVGCIGAVAVALLPITFMGGHDIFRWSKPVWATLYAVTLTLFVLVVFPQPDSWEAVSGPALATALVFGGFGLLSVSVWAWFRFREA